MKPFTIRGLALPFDEETYFDGAWESVTPDAIKPDGRDIHLFFANHDPQTPWASVGRKTLELFATSAGLWFEATISNREGATSIINAVQRGELGVSVCFREGYAGIEAKDGKEAFRRITNATIEHVSVTPSPAYAGTATWRADADPLDLAPRVQARAAQWARAFDQHRSRRDIGRAPARAEAAGGDTRHGVPGQRYAKTMPQSVVALLDRAEREGWAAKHAEVARTLCR